MSPSSSFCVRGPVASPSPVEIIPLLHDVLNSVWLLLDGESDAIGRLGSSSASSVHLKIQEYFANAGRVFVCINLHLAQVHLPKHYLLALSFICKMVVCPDNSTECLLKVLVEDSSQLNWNPLNFAFTAILSILAPGLALASLLQAFLASGPGHLKASQDAIGKYYARRSNTKFNTTELRFPTTVEVPTIDGDSILNLNETLDNTTHPGPLKKLFHHLKDVVRNSKIHSISIPLKLRIRILVWHEASRLATRRS